MSSILYSNVKLENGLAGKYINTSRADAVALSIVWLEYVLTLGEEIEFFWGHRKRWTVPNVLFFCSRYWALFVVTFDSFIYLSGWVLVAPFCKTYFQILHYNLALINILFVQLILTARVCGIYGDKKALRVTLNSLAWLCLFSSVLIINTGTSQVFQGVPDHNVVQVCANFLQGITEASNWTIWMPILMFDVVIFVLALQKTFGWLKNHNSPQNNLGTRVMKTIMHDSVLYFGVILALYCANAWTWGHAEAGIFQTTTIAINSSLASRMLLNIRKEGAARPSHHLSIISTGQELTSMAHLPMQDGTIYTPHMRSLTTVPGTTTNGLDVTVSMLEPGSWSSPRDAPVPPTPMPIQPRRPWSPPGPFRVYAYDSTYPSSQLVRTVIDEKSS